MTSRQTILAAIRRQQLAPVAPPDLTLPNWITYPDRAKQFAESLAFVGGKAVFLPSVAELPAILAEHPAYPIAKKIVSRIDSVPGTLDLDSVSDPHELADVDFALLPGQFGVAENGAIWCTDHGLKHRAIYFIPQHLVLVLDAREIVDNMHQAYARLKLGSPYFGCFISGPSKTADIEQSLVIGAHGARSLLVACIGS